MTPEDYDNKFSIVPSVPLKQRIELPSIGENYQGPSLNRLSPTVHIADFGTWYVQITTYCSFRFLPQMRLKHSMQFFATIRAQSRVCLISWNISVRTTMTYALPAAITEFEKTGKGPMAHKYAEHLILPFPSDRPWKQQSQRGHQVAARAIWTARVQTWVQAALGCLFRQCPRQTYGVDGYNVQVRLHASSPLTVQA